MRFPIIDRVSRDASRRCEVISFVGGSLAQGAYAREHLADAAQAVLLAPESDLEHRNGHRPLRERIAQKLRDRGADVDADDVVLTLGARDALGVVLDLLGRRSVQVDHATSPGVLDALEARGMRAVASAHQAVRYAMPAVQNPYGWQMTAEQRSHVLDCEVVIEDDAFSELHFEGALPTPLLAQARDRVFHLGSFSKTLSPGLRVGYLVAPPRWNDGVRRAMAQRDGRGSGVCQAIVERLISREDYAAHLAQLRAHCGKRAEDLVSLLPQLTSVRASVPTGGCSVWLETDLHAPDVELLQRGICHGVAFDPGCLFRAEPLSGRGLAMRLSFAAVPQAQMAQGVSRLADTLDEMRSILRAAA